jgi:hypothetical protein
MTDVRVGTYEDAIREIKVLPAEVERLRQKCKTSAHLSIHKWQRLLPHTRGQRGQLIVSK